MASLGETEGVLSLWHPLGAPPADVLRWRQSLEAHGIVQPFKQAHGEVYLLVFSEIMRDVGLFVGVASIGNDLT